MPVVSSYDPIDGSDVGTGDDFLIVDVSDTSQAATGTTKRITREELPAAFGLGKYVAVGYNGKPTWYDPAQAAWDDGMWWQFDPVNGNFTIGQGVSGSPDHVSAQVKLTEGVNREARYTFAAVDDAYNQLMQVFLDANASGDGTYLDGTAGLNGSGDGHAYLRGNLTAWWLEIKGEVGQTAPLLDLQDSDAASILSIAPDGSVGGTTPSAGDQLTWDGTKIVWAAP